MESNNQMTSNNNLTKSEGISQEKPALTQPLSTETVANKIISRKKSDSRARRTLNLRRHKLVQLFDHRCAECPHDREYLPSHYCPCSHDEMWRMMDHYCPCPHSPEPGCDHYCPCAHTLGKYCMRLETNLVEEMDAAARARVEEPRAAPASTEPEASAEKLDGVKTE